MIMRFDGGKMSFEKNHYYMGHSISLSQFHKLPPPRSSVSKFCLALILKLQLCLLAKEIVNFNLSLAALFGIPQRDFHPK